MAKINLAELEVDVDLAEITDKHAAELARGIQVSKYKEQHGSDAVLSRTAVYAGPELRDKVEKELCQRDRELTLRRWEQEKKIRLSVDEATGMHWVRIRQAPEDVVFGEAEDVFPSLKLMADVALAIMCVPHD